jgi:hypothetical protein
VPYLRVKSMGVLGRKPQGYGWDVGDIGWIKFRVDSNSSSSRVDDVVESSGYICSSRLGDVTESTRRSNRVDSAKQSSRLGEAIESTQNIKT